MTRRGRSGGDASDSTVIIYSKAFLSLSADDDGIKFRQGLQVERVGWEQISQFRDGGTGSSWGAGNRLAYRAIDEGAGSPPADRW